MTEKGRTRQPGMRGTNVGRNAVTRRSDRFAWPADRRELEGARSARWRRSCKRFLEQGASDRSEARAETEGCLGDPGSASLAAPFADPLSFRRFRTLIIAMAEGEREAK